MTQFWSFDPGLATGATLFYYSRSSPLQIVQSWTVENGCEGFIDFWRRYGYETNKVVAERFVIDGTITGTWAPQIEGFLKSVSTDITWQYRTDKSLKYDRLMKKIGWWTTGRKVGFKTARHILDSRQHGIVYMRNMHHLPTLRWLYPEGS